MFFRLVEIQVFCISRFTFLRFTFIDICTVAVKSLRNMNTVSINPVAYILRFNDKYVGKNTVLFVDFFSLSKVKVIQ